MHKMLNGVRVELTEEQEQAVLAQRAIDAQKQMERQKREEARQLQKQELLKKLGITQDDLKILLG